MHRAGISPWTPALLGSALALWLDAADEASITLNGSNVSQWRDRSGNGRNVAQSTASSQPQYEATGLNGKPALNSLTSRFLASGATALLRNVNSATFVAVSRFETPLTGGVGNAPLLFVSISTASSTTRFALNAFPSPGTAGTYSVGGRRLDADGFTTVVSSVAITANPVIWMGNADYANAQANTWLNGVPDISGATFRTAGNTSDTNSLGFGVFNASSANLQIYNNTRISEAIILHGALSTTDRQRLEGYLAWKWDLEANLPAGHPFKNTRPTV